MAFRRGDVVLIPFPYTDLSAAKTRPAVLVSSEAYHLHDGVMTTGLQPTK